MLHLTGLASLTKAFQANTATSSRTPTRWQPGPKAVISAMIVAGVVVAFVWALWPRPAPVDLAVVARGPMAVTVDEEGKTRIKDIFIVSAPVAGTMKRNPLLAGDAVEKERTIVAAIQPAAPPFLDFRTRLEVAAQARAAQAAVALAEAERAQAQSELTFAEREVERAATLLKTNVVAARAHERAVIDLAVRKAALAKTEANVAVRRQELESARAKLLGPRGDDTAGILDADCCFEVRAPDSGRVLKVMVTSEQVVTVGTPLVEIGDPRSLEIVVELLSTDAVRVRQGAAAVVDGWGGGQLLAARVRRIESAAFTKVSALGIEEQRVRVILDLLPGPTGLEHALGHEFRVLVRIVAWEAADALVIPIGALFRHEGQWAVFKLTGSTATLSVIAIGQRNADVAEVLSGLVASDRVVLHPSDRIYSGARVKSRASQRLP
ncbi:MAG: efflux RND transporter periplasmic adaptor subunit [Hyphomicrobiaceae bacterium]